MTIEELARKLDAAAEALTLNLSDLRQELKREIKTIRDRMDNLVPTILTIDARMSAISRNIDRFIGDAGDAANTQAAQQRAIDDLARRVAALERPQQ